MVMINNEINIFFIESIKKDSCENQRRAMIVWESKSFCNYSALTLETALSDGYLFRGYSLNLLQISIRQGFGDNFF
jgi:hypothetical protein